MREQKQTLEEEKKLESEKEKLYQILLSLSSEVSIPQKDLFYLEKNKYGLSKEDYLKVIGHISLDYPWNQILKFIKEKIKYYKENFEISNKEYKVRHFDEAWKKILILHLEDVVKVVNPKIWEEIDWSRGFENLCQELDRISFLSKTPGRIVDALFKAYLKNG